MANARRCETCHAYMRRDGGCTACEGKETVAKLVRHLRSERDQALADLRKAREAAVRDHSAHQAQEEHLHAQLADASALLADAQRRAADCDQLRDALTKSVAERNRHSDDALRMARYMGYAIAAAVVGALAAVAGWVR